MAKHIFFTLLSILLFTQISLGQAREIQKIDGGHISSRDLDNVILHLLDTANVTGLGISIFNDNRIVYQKAFGYSNRITKDTLSANTIFYGASLSKAVFSVLVMTYVEEGIIHLDSPLQYYLHQPLPDYKFAKSWQGYHDLKGDKRYEKITARMCLSHTTGFPNWRFLSNAGYDSEGKLYFLSDPGTRYGYSGEGMNLLQFVLEKLTGKGLEEMAQERIFKPLSMRKSSYLYVWQPGKEHQYAWAHDTMQNVLPKDEVDDAGGAGSMGTTLADYSKFLEAILNQQILKKTSYNEMFKKNVVITSKRQFGPDALAQTDENKDIGLGYGLGWGLINTPFGVGAFKEGSSEGYQHYSIIFPRKKIGVLIMTNSDNGDSILKELLEKSIGDSFTPWRWENYIPYDMKVE